MDLSKIKLFVFDMAGTTVIDKQEVQTCFAKACEATNLKVSDETILAVQGWSKKYVFEYLWARQYEKGSDEHIEKVEESYKKFKEILEAHYFANEVNPTLGCLEFFEFLKEKNIKIALTTGFYRKVSNIILEKLGWLIELDENHKSRSNKSIIDLSIASDEVENGRPAPDMIFKSMSTFNITDPKEVLKIGDTPSDLEAGLNAEVAASWGLTNGTHSESQLSACKNDGLFKSLADLHKYLSPVTVNA